MKRFLIITLIATVGATPLTKAAEPEIFRDNLLIIRTDGGFEQFSLAEIYLALPQDLFEGTFQQRVKDMIDGRPQFDPAKKEIYYPGDGGQAGLQIQVQIQTETSLILHVTQEFEREKSAFRLERIRNGWKRLE